MDNLVKVDASAVSYTSDSNSNNENFFMNGRYKYQYELDNIQVTLDTGSEEHIFAVSHGMDRTNSELNASVSMVKELKKFHEYIRGRGGDLGSKLEQLSERVEEISSILHSLSLGDAARKAVSMGFAGLFIDHCRAAAVNTGNTLTYLLRDVNLKQLTGSSGKTERLLRAGIITRDEAKNLSGRLGASASSSRTEIQKSDIIQLRKGDIFLLCSEGVSGVLDEDCIYNILSSGRDSAYMSNTMLKEALEKGAKDDITALVVRVTEIDGNEDVLIENEDAYIRKKGEPEERKNHTRNTAYIVAAIICVIMAGVLWHNFSKIWSGSDENGVQDVINTSEVSATASSIDLTGSGAEEDQTVEGDSGQDAGQSGDIDKAAGEQPADEVVTHIVKEGDTLQSISKKYYGDYEKYTLIMEKNNIKDPNKLQIGQELIIPKE